MPCNFHRLLLGVETSCRCNAPGAQHHYHCSSGPELERRASRAVMFIVDVPTFIIWRLEPCSSSRHELHSLFRSNFSLRSFCPAIPRFRCEDS